MSEVFEGALASVADPKLNQVVKRTLNILRLAAHKAVMHQSDPAHYTMSSDPNSFEAMMFKRVKTRKPEVIARATSKVKAFLALSATDRTKRFGDLAAVDLRAAKSVDEQVRALPVPAAALIDKTHLQTLLANRSLFLSGSPAVTGGLTPQTDLDMLEVRIRKVRCADETNGFLGSEAGDDEILLGGTAIDESGDAKVIKSFMVRDDFDDGESKSYNPPRRFTAFNLREQGNVWPKTYYVSFIFCEQDNGGFPEWLEALLKKVKDAIAPMIGTAIGAGLGTLIPIPGLGTLIGAAIGAIIGGLVSLIIDIWEDDVFPSFTTYANIKSYNHLFASGQHTSGEKYFWASAHGGKYECWFDWRVYAG